MSPILLRAEDELRICCLLGSSEEPDLLFTCFMDPTLICEIELLPLLDGPVLVVQTPLESGILVILGQIWFEASLVLIDVVLG